MVFVNTLFSCSDIKFEKASISKKLKVASLSGLRVIRSKY